MHTSQTMINVSKSEKRTINVSSSGWAGMRIPVIIDDIVAVDVP